MICRDIADEIETQHNIPKERQSRRSFLMQSDNAMRASITSACIRVLNLAGTLAKVILQWPKHHGQRWDALLMVHKTCLLNTSDAADELTRGDMGRRSLLTKH